MREAQPGDPDLLDHVAAELAGLCRLIQETGIPDMSLQERRAFPRAIAWHAEQERHAQELQAQASQRDLFWVKLGGMVTLIGSVIAIVEKLVQTWHIGI